jgi:prophage regulatory protein
MSNKLERLLTLRDVQKYVPYSKSHIYRLMREGKFPQSVPFGPRRVGWRESEILAYCEKWSVTRKAA